MKILLSIAFFALVLFLAVANSVFRRLNPTATQNPRTLIKILHRCFLITFSTLKQGERKNSVTGNFSHAANPGHSTSFPFRATKPVMSTLFVKIVCVVHRRAHNSEFKKLHPISPGDFARKRKKFYENPWGRLEKRKKVMSYNSNRWESFNIQRLKGSVI